MSHILIVDTGVDPARLGDATLRTSLALVEQAGRIEERPTLRDLVGHGTACAAMIARLAPGSEISSIRVLDETGAASVPMLVHAIGWGIRAQVDAINLSLGTLVNDEELESVCERAAAAGVILVAAEHNDGLVSYPAHLPTTIGVRGGRIHGDDAFHYCPGQPIECVARGDAQRVAWLGGRDVLMGGSSFAAPRITALVAWWKTEHPEAGLPRIRSLLRQRAARVVDAPSRRLIVDASSGDSTSDPYPWMRRATLYPFTKEMHAFVRFADLLPFEITGVADPPGRGLAGRDAGEAIGEPPARLPIHPRVAEATTQADTLILGYLGQFGALRGRDLHREHLDHALDRGLHVFSFESLNDDRYAGQLREARERGLHVVWPELTAEAAREVLRGQPTGGAVDVPVLAVVGTSSSQGKFTLQLGLRRHLQRRGYRVGQLGTEHHSRLFGMEHAFPMGYAATVHADTGCYPELVERLMRDICWRRRPDLILAGSQSGTIPFDLADHRTHCLPTLAFLLGVKPDACVLVVNAIDPEEHIRDTISALRTVVKSDVIALAVSDRVKETRQRHGRSWVGHRQAADGELAATTAGLEQRFGLPAVTITSPDGLERLVTAIEVTFAADKEASCRRKRA